MDEQDLNLLVLIGEGKKLKEIADELFITHPSLTYRLNKIEDRFSVKLFIRDNKGIRVTPQGEYLINYAENLTKEFKSIQEKLFTLSDKVEGSLNIGASHAIARHILPSLLKDFLFYYPDVEPYVTTGFTPELTDMLIKEKIHIAFLRENIEWRYLKKFIRSENVYIVSKQKINLDELTKLTRIEYTTNRSLKLLIDQWWRENFKYPPIINSVVDSADVCLEFVRNNLGYAILTELGLAQNIDLNHMPIIQANGELLTRETWLYLSKNAKDFYTVNSFIKFLEENDIFNYSY